jgi:copper chaperone CopZ
MRQLVAAVAVAFLAGFGVQAARAEKVEIKGVHLCCPACVKSVAGILGKVDGVSDAKCDRAEKTVTFTASDAKTARKAFDALRKGGFFGQATCEGKEMKTKNTASKDKAAKVTVNDVHVCCGACKKAVEKLFKDATITYTGDGPQRNVTIAGENLTPAAVLQTLRAAGFNGTVSKE